MYNTLIVPDGGLGGGVYGGRGSAALPRIRAQLMQGCTSTTNFRPAAVGVGAIVPLSR